MMTMISLTRAWRRFLTAEILKLALVATAIVKTQQNTVNFIENNSVSEKNVYSFTLLAPSR